MTTLRRRSARAVVARCNPVGYDRIIAATTPDKSSAVIAAELGVSPEYVRAVWRRRGFPRRVVGKHPLVCASSPRPTAHERTT